jgi:hypothetical protein
VHGHAQGVHGHAQGVHGHAHSAAETIDKQGVCDSTTLNTFKTPTTRQSVCVSRPLKTPENQTEASTTDRSSAQAKNTKYSNKAKTSEPDISTPPILQRAEKMGANVGDLNLQRVMQLWPERVPTAVACLEEKQPTVKYPTRFLQRAIEEDWRPETTKTAPSGFREWFDEAQQRGLVVGSQRKNEAILVCLRDDNWLPFEQLRQLSWEELNAQIRMEAQAMSFDQSRYLKDWDEISLSIRTAASWTCEACGRVCRRPGEPWPQFCERMGWNPLDPNRNRKHYVLTTAHLDQDPQNCDRKNLKALCSLCHLRYDSRFRATQKRLIAELNGQQRIDSLIGEGLQLSLLLGRIAPSAPPLPEEVPKAGRALSPPEQVFDPLLSAQGGRSVGGSCSGGNRRKKRRRHTPKGSACGWIEERVGNRKRSHPTVSYYYRWDEPEGRGTVYVPVAIAPVVKRMVEVERQPVSRVLEFIRKRKKEFYKD